MFKEDQAPYDHGLLPEMKPRWFAWVCVLWIALALALSLWSLRSDRTRPRGKAAATPQIFNWGEGAHSN